MVSLWIMLLVLSCSPYQVKVNGKDIKKKQKNILFIAVDDLRLQADVFGQSMMKTPTLDRLGHEGVVFERAYCNVPVCGASRASLMSGLRPTYSRFRTYNTRKEVDAPDVPSLARWFKDHGYLAFSNGKIYHHSNDDLSSWSEKPFNPSRAKYGEEWGMFQKNESLEIIEKYNKRPAYEDADVSDEGYPEGLLVKKVINDLTGLSYQDKPFFMSVGFWKPHLPFCAPKKYWELYDTNEIRLADNPYKPRHAPRQSMHNWNELRNYYGIPQEGNLNDDMARKLIHGYYASVSYTDAQIAKLLDALDKLGLRENTIVILWGDHGWHLGEHTLWCKHCNFDRVLNAPLIVSAPGFTEGGTTASITEFIDIYPSLCELCELPLPEHLDGKSFVPVLKDTSKSIKEYAYSRYHKGETVVSKDYAYTEWYDCNKGIIEARMLYNLNNDPGENENVAEKEEYRKTVKKMSNLLNKMRDNHQNQTL